MKQLFNTGDIGKAIKKAASDWDESEHPRVPAGSDRGGEFVEKGNSVEGYVGSKEVTDKYIYTTPIKDIESYKKSNIESKEKENDERRKRIENEDYDLTKRFNRYGKGWEETPESEKANLLNEKINNDKESILLNEKIIKQIKSGKLDSEINRDVNKDYYKSIDKREIEIANRFTPNQSTMQNIRDEVGNILKIKKENKFNSKGNTAYLETEKYKIRFSDHDSRAEQDDYILQKESRYRPKEFDREDINVKIYKDNRGNAIINVSDNTYQISDYNINHFSDLANFIIKKIGIKKR
jgi:hypothetical protein